MSARESVPVAGNWFMLFTENFQYKPQSFEYCCGRPWPAAYINIIQNVGSDLGIYLNLE